MKKLNDPVRKVNAYCAGLDVHKGITVYTLFDPKGAVAETGDFRSTRADFEDFIKRVLKNGETHFTFEASRSSLWVHGLIREFVDDEYVHVAQSKRIKAIANSNSKNDDNDSWWLGYLTYEGRLPEAHVPEHEILELRIATRERAAAVQHRTKIICRLKAHFAQVGLIVPGSSIRTKQAQLFMAEQALQIKGVRGRALRSCLDELNYQDFAIQEWNDVIGEVSALIPAVETIEGHIPGIGSVLAATIVAEAGDLKRFHSQKAFGRTTGLTPSDRSSSGKTIHGGITREGNPHLRWALTQAAIGCLRARKGAGLAVGNWIRAREKRMGNKSKARAAGGRKLAESIWRLFHLGECFDAAHSFGGVPK